MSFSFNVRAGSVHEAQTAVRTELEKVLAAQPIHDADVDAALSTSRRYLSVIGEPAAGHELCVGVNGSVTTIDGVTRGASVGVTVNMILVTANAA